MLFKAIIECYEGLAVVRTVDPEKGIVQLLISPDFVDEVEHILEDLSSHVRIIPVPRPPASHEDTDNRFFEDT